MNRIKCPLCETETTEEKLYDARVRFLTEKRILQQEFKTQLEKAVVEMAKTRKSNCLYVLCLCATMILYLIVIFQS